MAYAPPALRRRARRRRIFVTVIILAVMLGLIGLAVRNRTDRRVAVDYLDTAKAIVDDERILSTRLEEIFTAVGDLERNDLLERLSEIAATSEELRAALDDAERSAAVAEAHGFLSVAVGAWDDAAALLEGAIVEVLDGEDEQTGDGMLRSAFDLLRIGDRAYFGFTQSLTELDPEIQVPTFGEVSFAGGDRSSLYDAMVVALRLRTILKLEGDHDVSLVVSIDPEPLVETNSVPIVPNSEIFVVNLVVSNEGNLVEELILVSLEGDPQSAEVEPISLQSIVPFLEPGQSTTIAFDVAELVTAGELYELRAAVQITEDDTPDNNSWSLVLVRNAE
jgi:hypothetical protein